MTLSEQIEAELKRGEIAEESLYVRLFGHRYEQGQYQAMLDELRRIASARNMGWNTYNWRLR